jgi:hypothetical protein
MYVGLSQDSFGLKSGVKRITSVCRNDCGLIQIEIGELNGFQIGGGMTADENG